ncbi:diacylglycerol kinase family protein [Terrabacter terrae]|uniref:Diacylglycerol kinase family protein n=1 Tax=Terrabacter terrae TaxID=318434 RepID=A0ABN2UKC6_9MICO
MLFVDTRNGDGSAGGHAIADLARDRGIEAVTSCSGGDLRARVSEVVADGADALGMAGGDGSLALVAAVAAAHELPFVCIPVGTRNHFARDLGMDVGDVADALDAFTVGVEREIDVGVVNGRMFLNSVSLAFRGGGRRGDHHDAGVCTLGATARRVLVPGGLMPELRPAEETEGEQLRPGVLLISNNPYALEGPSAGTRPTLASRRLGVLFIDAWKEMRPSPGRAWSASHLDVQAADETRAGIDGDEVQLLGPLRFDVQPAALRVRISRRHPGAPPLARLPSWSSS